jgi:HPt (histidine-containing phosphotransfer) domain-containing protein
MTILEIVPRSVGIIYLALPTAPMMPESTFQPLTIDRERLHQICDGDADFELELLQMLAADVTEQLPVLWRAIDSQSSTELKNLAHYLKGSTANLGLNSMSSIALKLEEAAAIGNFEAAKIFFSAFQDQQAKLLASLPT